VPPVGLLFVFLGACFLGVAYTAAHAGTTAGWVVAAASVALAAWFGNAAWMMAKRRR
jgi:TRAP-type mannitol/chloroaromatic compound transport system permease large subunit